MKIKFLKSSKVINKQRQALTCATLLCLVCLALIPAAAQVKNQKRVSLQLGDAVEGSRVTVVSDSALSDYEAFRRGDRFYVKLPLAEFATAVPGLRANGFDDVQVQRVGDGLIISFKLQPGASARVSLRGNRLDVIFTAANRSFYVANRTVTPNEVHAENPDRGPTPPGSTSGSLERFVSETTSDGSRGPQDPWAINPATGVGRRGRGNSGGQPAASTTETASALQSPAPAFTPAVSPGYPALSATSPANTATSTSSVSRSGSSPSQRASSLAQWVATNRLATLLGALVLLALILYLVLAFRKRREGTTRARLAKANKVQPKVSEGEDLSEISPSPIVTPITSLKNEAAAQYSAVTPDRPVVQIPSTPQPSRVANAYTASRKTGKG